MRIALAAIVSLGLAGCMSAAQPAQVVTLGPSPAPPWSVLRDALAGCAAQQGISGELRVRIDIDDDGGAGEVSANRGGGEFTHCVGQSLAHVRFPTSHRGRGGWSGTA